MAVVYYDVWSYILRICAKIKKENNFCRGRLDSHRTMLLAFHLFPFFFLWNMYVNTENAYWLQFFYSVVPSFLSYVWNIIMPVARYSNCSPRGDPVMWRQVCIVKWRIPSELICIGKCGFLLFVSRQTKSSWLTMPAQIGVNIQRLMYLCLTWNKKKHSFTIL